jgi:hypothetical protein
MAYKIKTKNMIEKENPEIWEEINRLYPKKPLRKRIKLYQDLKLYYTKLNKAGL